MATTTYTPKQEFANAGSGTIESASVTIGAGQVLLAGTVLGKVTASGEYKKSLVASGDGSEKPVAYLLEDVDTTAGAITNEPIRIKSTVLESFLIIEAGQETAVKEALRPLGIYIKKGVQA